MLDSKAATNAYQTSSTHRSLREQEADVFQRATGALRSAQNGTAVARVRALADNRRLWTAVIDLLRDPRNSLPERLRATIVSLGLAVQREMDRDEPDIAFLITVNENIAAGLSGG